MFGSLTSGHLPLETRQYVITFSVDQFTTNELSFFQRQQENERHLELTGLATSGLVRLRTMEFTHINNGFANYATSQM